MYWKIFTEFLQETFHLLRWWTQDDPILIPDCKDQGTQTEEEICGRTAPVLGPHPGCRILIQLQQLGRALVAADPFVAWPTPAFTRMEKKRSADAMEDADLQGPTTVLEQFHIIIGAHWHFFDVKCVFLFLAGGTPLLKSL